MEKIKLPGVTAIGEILYDVYPDKKRLGVAPFNFIYHVWKILVRANVISSVGNDDNGKEIINYLNSIGFDTGYIIIDNKFPTGTVQVKIDENKIPRFKISCECSYDYISLDDKAKNLFNSETDLLAFGTLTMRDEISRNTIVSLFNKPGKKYFCDLNLRHDFFSKELIEKVLRTCNVIKLNKEELDKLKTIFNLYGNNNSVVKQLINIFDIELVAVTLGEDGAELYKGDKLSFSKLSKGKIVDSLGAGDAFSAILCIGYLYNMELEKLNQLANEFAFQICMVNGALPAEDSIYKPFREVFF